MRILCLDIGTKRIGVAASDPMGWTAQPVKVIERKGDAYTFEAIVAIALERQSQHIVVGLPLDSQGQLGYQARRVKAFASRLKAHLQAVGVDASVEFWDESYSTQIAEERLIAADLSRRRRRKVIDKMAAVVILEDYLRAHESQTVVDESTQG